MGFPAVETVRSEIVQGIREVRKKWFSQTNKIVFMFRSPRTVPGRIKPRLLEMTLNGGWRGGSGRNKAIRKKCFLSDLGLHIPQDGLQKGGNWHNIS